MSRVFGPDARGPLLAALAAALVVQGPLGWWLIRSIGTRRFLAAYSIGLGSRVGLLGIAALVVLPRVRWPLETVLIPLAVLLIALLAVEGLVLMLSPSGDAAR